MKLTHLSFIILTSLGLSACGSSGSDAPSSDTKLNVANQSKATEEKAKDKALADLANKQRALEKAQADLRSAENALNVANQSKAAEEKAKDMALADLASKQTALDQAQKALQQAEARLVEFEKEKQLAQEKAEQVGKEYAEYKQDNLKREQWFKSHLGDPIPDVYGEGFNTEKVDFISVDGQEIMLWKMNNDQQAYEAKIKESIAKPNARYTLGENRVYKQQYSSVWGFRRDAMIVNSEITTSRFGINRVVGSLTPENAIPNAGTATYSGVAFGAFGKGDLTYQINFAEKSGEGRISNVIDVKNVADIVLQKGQIQGNMIESSAITENPKYTEYFEPTQGKYIMGIYGPNAEEIAGKVVLKGIPRAMWRSNDAPEAEGKYNAEIGFAGKR